MLLIYLKVRVSDNNDYLCAGSDVLKSKYGQNSFERQYNVEGSAEDNDEAWRFF